MAAALRWINGERVVVLLYTAQILSAAPVSLLKETISLSILSLFALFLDIFADQHDPFSQFFSTRAGATSGILVGAVTLPGLMLSILIQMNRGLPLTEVGLSDFEYFRLQYWAASAACFSVMASLLFFLRRKANGGVFVHSCWLKILGVCCVTLYAGLRCIALCKKIHFGWHMELIPIWVIFHGSAAVNIIQNILLTFPACASIGEALLVTSGLVIYSGDMLTLTAVKISGNWALSSFPSIKYGVRSEISIIVQGMTIGLLLFPILFKFVYQTLGRSRLLGIYMEQGNFDMKKSMIFYVSLALMLVVVVPSWMQFVKDFHRHPLLWVLDFVLSEPLRLSICKLWVALICASVTLFYRISKNGAIERILLRKYYHLIAVIMFVPALIYEPEFLDLAFGAALAVFLILEIIRGWRIWPLGQLVHQFMNAFTDHRDSEILVISHFSLLLGCALPMWLSSGFNDRPLAPFAGILSLGIGDTMASMIGYKFGVLRWSKTGKKTVEGTGAGIICVLIACFVLHYLDSLLKGSTGYSYTEMQNIRSLLVAVTASGLLEAFTVQLDNAFIPLVFYSLLCL